MNANQVNTQAQDDVQESPVLVEELSIDELAVREEYSSCYTVK